MTSRSTSRRALTTIGTCAVLGFALAGTASANGYPQATNLSTTKVSTTSATIAWKGVNYSGENRYRISWHERQSPGRSWTSSGNDYGISASPLTLTGLLPGHVYDVSVSARDASGWFGSNATTVVVLPGTRATAAPATCVTQTVMSTPTATFVRTSPKTLRVTGSLSYFSASSWYREPTSDYALTVQQLKGSTWTRIAAVAPNQAATIPAGAGTYRLSFDGSCSMPYGTSTSVSVTR